MVNDLTIVAFLHERETVAGGPPGAMPTTRWGAIGAFGDASVGASLNATERAAASAARSSGASTVPKGCARPRRRHARQRRSLAALRAAAIFLLGGMARKSGLGSCLTVLAQLAARIYEYTPFCNGPRDVKSPRVIVTPPSLTIAIYKPDSWKSYTIGDPLAPSKFPWRLDDEQVMYPFYEKVVKAGITTICIHKGLLCHSMASARPATFSVPRCGTRFLRDRSLPARMPRTALDALLCLALWRRKIFSVRYDLRRYRGCCRNRFSTGDQTLFSLAEPAAHCCPPLVDATRLFLTGAISPVLPENHIPP
jgi:hypothetical protein